MPRSSYIYVVNRLHLDGDGYYPAYRTPIGAWTVKRELVTSLADLFEVHRFPFEAHRFKDGQALKLASDRVDMSVEIERDIEELLKERKKMRGKR